MSTGKKRFWSDDEKREICGQTRVEGASVAVQQDSWAVRSAKLLSGFTNTTRMDNLGKLTAVREML
jgi:hypothetical protein